MSAAWIAAASTFPFNFLAPRLIFFSAEPPKRAKRARRVRIYRIVDNTNGTCVPCRGEMKIIVAFIVDSCLIFRFHCKSRRNIFDFTTLYFRDTVSLRYLPASLSVLTGRLVNLISCFVSVWLQVRVTNEEDTEEVNNSRLCLASRGFHCSAPLSAGTASLTFTFLVKKNARRQPNTLVKYR